MKHHMKTGQLADGTRAETLGRELNHADDPEHYEELVEQVMQAPDGQMLAWFAHAGSGILVRTTPERREAWKLPADCAGTSCTGTTVTNRTAIRWSRSCRNRRSSD